LFQVYILQDVSLGYKLFNKYVEIATSLLTEPELIIWKVIGFTKDKKLQQ